MKWYERAYVFLLKLFGLFKEMPVDAVQYGNSGDWYVLFAYFDKADKDYYKQIFFATLTTGHDLSDYQFHYYKVEQDKYGQWIINVSSMLHTDQPL